MLIMGVSSPELFLRGKRRGARIVLLDEATGITSGQ
jgi:hypothetical protein